MSNKVTYEFEVIKVMWHHNRGDFIFVRHLGVNHNINVPDGSFLAGIPVYHYSKISPSTVEDAVKQVDLFVFRPMSLNRIADDLFKEGQVVNLIIENLLSNQL